MSDMTFYTMNEVLSKASASATFVSCLYDYDNLQNVPEMILANCQDWYGLWVDSDSTETALEIECINIISMWTAWLRMKAVYLNDYITRQSGLTGTTTSIGKFLDTPETESDYSGDTHITSINKSETTADNVAGLEALRPIVESLVSDFRRTWLLPKEAI